METNADYVFYVIRDRKSGMFVKKTARDFRLTSKLGQARTFANYKIAKNGYNPRMYRNFDLYIQPVYGNLAPCEEM